jgi:cell division septation protein DedD
MSSSNDSESEILLGNKQLLGIFAVVAILLAVSFTGGYMVGKNNAEKKATAASDGNGTADSSVLVTRTVPPANAPDASVSESKDTTAHDDSQFVAVPLPAPDAKVTERPAAAHQSQIAPPPSGAEASPVSASFTPEAGQTFLQVAAVGKDEADAVADVLHKKGFRAHSVQKPGSAKIYRVLIGPLKDAGDLAATRDSLRKTGFREVIVQHY